MAGKFEVKVAKNGKFHFSLKSSNGQTILTSQMYATKSGCKNGVKSVMTNAAKESMFDRLESENGKPYFVLKASNGQIVGRSQLYESERSMENGIKAVMNTAPEASVAEIN